MVSRSNVAWQPAAIANTSLCPPLVGDDFVAVVNGGRAKAGEGRARNATGVAPAASLSLMARSANPMGAARVKLGVAPARRRAVTRSRSPDRTGSANAPRRSAGRDRGREERPSPMSLRHSYYAAVAA